MGQQDPALPGAVPGAAVFQRGEWLFDDQQYTQAVVVLDVAAKQGHPAANARLGEMFLNAGTDKYAPVVRDYTRAEGYLRSSATQRYAFGQTRLGKMHQFGFGAVEQSDSAALTLYRQAAPQGEAGGQAALGSMLAKGKGVARVDHVKALFYFEAAANQGNAAGQYYVAGYRGVTNAEDAAEDALFWMTLSANQNWNEALKNLPGYRRACTGECADRAVARAKQFTRKTACAASGFTADNFCGGRGTPVELDDSVQRICVCQRCSGGFTGTQCQTAPATTGAPTPRPPPTPAPPCRDQPDASCLGDEQSGWQQYTCAYAKDYCSSAPYGGEARRCCPLACGVCTTAPTAPPPTTTATPPTTCPAGEEPKRGGGCDACAPGAFKPGPASRNACQAKRSTCGAGLHFTAGRGSRVAEDD